MTDRQIADRLANVIEQHQRCHFDYRMRTWSCGIKVAPPVSDGSRQPDARAAHVATAIRTNRAVWFEHDDELAALLGWRRFGTHADVAGEELDFAGTDDGGMPVWERPTVHPRCEHTGEPYDTITRLTINIDGARSQLAEIRHVLSSGYACTLCAIDDLRRTVGLTAANEHEHI